MSSSSPRSRINQFFPSRKRKPILNDGKPDPPSKTPTSSPSPSAKGSLETYLVKSPDDVSNRASSLPSPGRPKIKRNLTKEISLTCDDVSVSRSEDVSISRSEEKKDDAAPGNSELKKFATDFLSLYCSDLSTRVNVPAEKDLKGKKRNGTPSVLVACIETITKKQRVLDHTTISAAELANSSGSNDCPKSFKVNGEGDGAVGGLSLRRCSNTPKSLIKMGVCNIAGETPKSISRSSMFSPGDEFWNEAIQVADGLFLPVDGKLLNDRSSGVALKDARNIELGGCAKPVDEIDENFEGSEKSPSIEHKQVSPLPVKHFDFSRELNHIVKNSSSCHCIDEVGPVTDSSSINPVVPAVLAKRSDSVAENGLGLAISDKKCNFLAKNNDIRRSEKVEFRTKSDNKWSGANNSVMSSVGKADVEEAGTPSTSMHSKDHVQLSSWLPSEVCSIYLKKGISKLYPWQVDCLLVDGVLEKRNLVYCASTSAGKSFVAEILMLRRVISTEKMALLVLPYVSICAEKAEHLELLLDPLGKHVRSFYGNQGGGSLPKDTSVAVCTIEKANSLINRLLEEGRLSEVGIIVIDELHMVGDTHRGYLLELMLTKLRYAAGEGNSEPCSDDSPGSSSGKGDPAHGLQIVGMSATMPNVGAVADWLQAALYETEFRPVPLEEYIKVGNRILDKKLNVVRMISETAQLGGKDPDHIVELCNEVVQEGHSVLLFCSSRKGCESTARHVSRFLTKYSVGMRDVDCDYEDASSALEALRKSPAGLDPILEETLPCGVAYHHAGLTVEEREVIETCYRKGIVRVLTATSTLAAGVNLPARRVIFRQPRIGRDFIDGTRYKQMSGRAGRTGIDTKGESILICKPNEVKRVTSILNDSCPPLQSCLSEDKNGMTHAILEVVSGGIVQTASDINRYVKCTLLNSTKPFEDVVKSAQDSLRWLCHKKFLEWNEDTRLYSSTPLGRASFGSSLTPEESLIVLDDLSRAREGFVLASDLHLVYLVTPINVEVEPDWELYYERFMELPTLDQSVGNRVGVAEPFLMRRAHGAPMLVQDSSKGKKCGFGDKLQKQMAANNKSLLSNEQTLRVCRRFYVALMLSRLVQEVPIADVCEAFKVSRGMIQGLQENAGRFASMVSVFCERLGWHDFEGIIAKFQNRVSFGVRAEIVELTTIPYVKGSRARALYKAGLRTPLAIAEASIPEIAKALFESSAWAGQEGSSLRRVQMGVAKKIKNGARKIVLDQAEEARVAAFSTFKSLGVDVPNMSRPSLSNVEDYSTRNGGTISSKKVSRPSYNDIILEKPQFLARPATDGRNITLNHSSLATLKNSYANTSVTVEVIGEVNSTRGVRDTCTTAVGGSVAMPYDKLQIIELETKNTTKIAGDADDADKMAVPDQRESDTMRGSDSNYNNHKFNDQGPTNASNFPGGIDCFLDRWEAENEFYFDIHFSEQSEVQSPILFEVFGLAICWENSRIYYVNLWKDLAFARNGDVSKNSPNATKDLNVHDVWALEKSRWDRIAKIMSQHGVRKITWNLKRQIQVLKIPCISVQRLGKFKFDDKLSGINDVDSSYILLSPITVHDGIDMCLAAWILWPDEESKLSPNLEKVVKKHLSAEVAAAANRSGRWKNQMRKAAHDGCCRRVAQSRALCSILWKLVASEGLVEAITGIENPLVGVLADMELWGIGVDMEGCFRARHILVRKLNELEKEAHRLAGISFSLSTTADIANVLYSRLKLPIPQSGKKGKLHPSTDKHSLDMLKSQHPIVSVIKEHRTLSKLLNSTLGSICSRARLCMKSQKYIVKGHWLQTSTATGRLSMEEPNLQCVEHLVVFTIHHSENNPTSSERDQHQINPRDFFIPTRDNWLLLTADYSQIELRLMAHFSKDPALIELLSKPDGDCFTMIAARWTGKLESTITSRERDQTKRLVYGILYGMGVNSLAEQLECSSEEAADKIHSFKASFPAVSAWLCDTVASCRLKGYITTLMGRKRFLSKIKFGSNKEKAKAERQAVNSICQGSAADIIKIAMIKIHGVIAEGSETPYVDDELAVKFSMLKGRCRIMLQVHDELVLETDPCLLREAASLLQMSMENAASLLVPLNVKLKFGRTWGSLETFCQETEILSCKGEADVE